MLHVRLIGRNLYYELYTSAFFEKCVMFQFCCRFRGSPKKKLKIKMIGKCIFLTTIPFSAFKNYLLTVKIWFFANLGYSMLISDNRANKRLCKLSES